MPMWMTLEPGGRRQVHGAAELAQALDSWSAREPGSFVVLETPAGRRLHRDWRRRGQRPRWSGWPPRCSAAAGD